MSQFDPAKVQIAREKLAMKNLTLTVEQKFLCPKCGAETGLVVTNLFHKPNYSWVREKGYSPQPQYNGEKFNCASCGAVVALAREETCFIRTSDDDGGTRFDERDPFCADMAGIPSVMNNQPGRLVYRDGFVLAGPAGYSVKTGNIVWNLYVALRPGQSPNLTPEYIRHDGRALIVDKKFYDLDHLPEPEGD